MRRGKKGDSMAKIDEMAKDGVAKLGDMRQVDRIKRMEKCLDESKKAIEKMEKALKEYEKAQGSYKKLCDYYGSAKWLEDYEADEKGKLPKSLKRGVLSEDGVYDLITENHKLTVRLLKIITGNVEGNRA